MRWENRVKMELERPKMNGWFKSLGGKEIFQFFNLKKIVHIISIDSLCQKILNLKENQTLIVESRKTQLRSCFQDSTLEWKI